MMKLYRGQRYGEPVGEWWTDSQEEAATIARSGARSYVVLCIDEDDSIAPFLKFPRDNGGDWYQIPLAALKQRWFGVTIVDGAIDLGVGRKSAP